MRGVPRRAPVFRTSHVHLLKTCLAVIGLQAAAAVSAAVSVSPGGQAGYSQAIAVPPGIAGMVPNLAFSYTDGGINGPLGVGWSVQGISTVTRCPASKPIDPTNRTVFFDGADKLCLDGQRLIQTNEDGSPTATANGKGVPVATQVNDALGLNPADLSVYREFRTEKDSFARVRAYGSIDGDPNKGPAFFKVWTKSGQIYHYGIFGADRQALVLADPTGNGTPKIGAVWAVHRISDTLGNYIDFKYTQADVAWGSGTTTEGRKGHEWNISEIHYTGAPGQAPANKVAFTYDPRPADAVPGHDRAEAYQRAAKNVNLQRLLAVKSFVNITGMPVAVRVHKLAYERSPRTGRSRLISITECAGANENACLPPSRFSYTDGGSADFTPNTAFQGDLLSTTKMLDASENKYGALTGDFNGDGRTDILRWANTTSLNELHFSNGDGSFTRAPDFNITTQHLFKNDGCYYAIAADFNGDGLSDLLRVAKASCSPNTNLVFLSAGDGSFSSVTLPSTIDLTQTIAVKTSTGGVACMDPQRRPPTLTPMVADSPVADPPAPDDERDRLLRRRDGAEPITPSSCIQYERTRGKNYHLIDFDGDGFLDILTTVAPNYSWNSGWGQVPSETGLCAGVGVPAFTGPCTQVFRGRGDGSFDALNVMASSSLYADPPDPQDKGNPYWRRPHLADVNGDGLQDIFSRFAGLWISNGNGSFSPGAVQDETTYCPLPIDFNGDQRTDCLRTDPNPALQYLNLHYSATSSGSLAQFNLDTTGHHLYERNSSDKQTIGVVAEDFNGDGRGDLLRWGQTTGDNGIYFSNGDGSFAVPRAAAGLQSITRPLQGIDRKTSFMLGDFLGNGTLQILHLKHAPSTAAPAEASSNQLYVRAGGGLPVDLLATATSSTGLVSTVGPRVTLSNSGGAYVSERNSPMAGQGNVVDLQAPMYVITSLTQQTGTGSQADETITTRYLYKGLKAERGGRGMLGFRETRQQSPAPNGDPLTVVTEYVQRHPYIGVASRTETHLSELDLAGPLLSRTTYSYCDKTSGSTPEPIPDPPAPPAPCSTTARVARPYLYQSVEEGWDLAGKTLPKVTTTNTYNATVDPLTITVVTTGNALDLAQTFTKTTTNTYFADQTAGEKWILARLQRTTVRNQVPNSLPSIATSAGTSPQATAQNGSGPPPEPAVLPPAVLSVILQLLLDD